MLGKLIAFFTKGTTLDETPVQLVGSHKDVNTDEEVKDLFVSWSEVEQSFIGMLLGVNSLIDGPMSKKEKSSLETINKRYLQNETAEYQIPRLPAVIPKVLQALRDTDTDADTLANILSADMVLVSEVLRLANSAFYSRSRVYESLEQAIVNIGFDGIRQLIVSAAVKPILNGQNGHFSKVANHYLWDKSVNTGLLSDRVAKTLGENSFHAYLAGLVVQSGMTVLSREFDKYFDDNEVPNNQLFIDKVSRYCYQLSVGISRQWQFPEPVIDALQELVTCEDPMAMSALGRITYLSDKLVKMSMLKENGHLKTFDGNVSQLIADDMHDVYLHCLKQLDISC